MRKLRKTLKKSKSGFTLAETLIAILILLMVSAIVAGAIPAASTVYTKTVDAANAQILLSTTITVLRDQLGTATDPQGQDGNIITFKSGESGNWCMIWLNDATLELYLGSYDSKHKTDPDDYKINGEQRHYSLITKKAATSGMVISFEGITALKDGENDVGITITGLKVSKQYKDGTTVELTTPRDLNIRTVS